MRLFDFQSVLYRMKTKITKKSISIVNNKIVKPYFNVYESLKEDVNRGNKTVIQNIYTKEHVESWQFSSRFMPQNIQEQIYNKFRKCYSLSEKTEQEIVFTVMWFTDESTNLNSQIVENLIRALSCMIVISKFSRCKLKNRQVVFRMFDIDSKKFFPVQGQTITPDHVNSAYTIPCRYASSNKLEIVIFRNEEWQKVLFHELIHTYSLDIGHDTEIMKTSLSNMFSGLVCDFNLTEAYCEFWARTIWTLIVGRLNNEKQIELLNKQQVWSIKQALHVADIMQIGETGKCREKTSAFSYYVITAYLLTAYPSVIDWCMSECHDLIGFPNNSKGKQSFLELLYDIVNSPTIREEWHNVFKSMKSRMTVHDDRRVTARMSVV